MKICKILSAAAAVLAAVTLLLTVLSQREAAMAAGAVLLVCACAAALLLRKQARFSEILLRENKQLKAGKPWNEEDIAQLEKQRRASELSALQYQINPHFLYNTLDTIRGQALLDDKADIAQMAEKLSRFFRYSISNRDNIVRVEEEVRHIEDYLYIQKKRFGDRFDAQILYASDVGEYYMLKLLLQPLVENAITHGLERMREKGQVTITFLRSEKNLLIHILDNGVGMPPEKLNEFNDKLETSQIFVPQRTGRHTGIAVQNVNARIRMTFGEEYGMLYRSEPGEGTLVVVTLPLVDDFSRIRYEELK